MEFEWDDNKNRLNARVHGLDFNEIGSFEWNTAYYQLDMRSDYGETRIITTGLYQGRITVIVFAPRGGRIRIISWRKANRRETTSYGYKN